MTQERQKAVLETRSFSRWKKEHILSFYKQTELKSSRRSHVYLHLLISLCTVLGQGRKALSCSETKWITLQNYFSRVWSSLTSPSRLYGAAQKWGTADWWYFFPREAVSPCSPSSYTFSRCGHSPKRMLKSIEKWKRVHPQSLLSARLDKEIQRETCSP